MNNYTTDPFDEVPIDPSESSLGTAIHSVGANFSAGKERLADALEQGSDRLISGAITLEEKAFAAADKLSDGAQYIREFSGGTVLRDCGALVSKYPFQAVAFAWIAGILLGCSFRRGGKEE